MGAARAFRFIDLFAGIGGFHHSLGSMGGECALAVEIDPDAQRTYRAAFPDFPADRLIGDIRSLTQRDGSERSLEDVARVVPDHDVLCAGFPCQPFSKSGAQMGVRDKTRGTLFFDVMTIVMAKQPRFLLLENVRNLSGPRHRDTWTTVIDSIQEAGYRVSRDPLVFSPHLLPPHRGGAPQVRDRVFILATRLEVPTAVEDRDEDVLVWREPVEGWDPGRWSVSRDVLLPGADLAEYGIRPDERGWLEAWQWLVQQCPDRDLPGFPMWADVWFGGRPPIIDDTTPPWKADFLRKNWAWYQTHAGLVARWRRKRWGPLRERVEDFPNSRRKFEWQARKVQPEAEQRDLEGLVAHLRPSGIRVKPPTYLPALVAITQTSVAGPKVTGSDWRRITPIEAARLQGITDAALWARAGVRDAVAYKQLGNAVNVGVVRFLAEILFEHGRAPWLRTDERALLGVG